MTIVLYSTDLMAGSKVSAAAAHMGVPLVTVSSTSGLIEACGQDDVRMVILDLTSAGLDPADVVPKLHALPSQPGKVLAFGPHVHAQWLQAARDAGCDEVISRGEFHARLETIVAECRG